MAFTNDSGSVPPLSPRVYHILLAVVGEARNGYQIAQSAEDSSAGHVRLGSGTLYEALHRLVGQGLLEEVDDPDATVNGRGQRFYALTRAGRRVLKGEAERLANDVQAARRARVYAG